MNTLTTPGFNSTATPSQQEQEQEQEQQTDKMTTNQTLLSPHTDYIHAIAFDHYGQRLATCSGDRTVKIWDLDSNNEWTSNDNNNNSQWTAHLSGVTGVSWAHPEFGRLLATSSSDTFCTIWEERTEGTATRWTHIAQLSDASKSLTCVKFAPRHLRLQLATASADGCVRIYEAVDVMNLSQWVLNSCIDVEGENESNYSSSKNSKIANFGQRGELGVTCLDWCTGRFEPPTLVVGGSSGNVCVYRYSDASKSWGSYVRLEGHVDLRRGVLDVAWSPNVGRSYHLIVSCGRDGVMRVHKLKRETNYEGQGNRDGSLKVNLKVESSQVLETQGTDVWRCAWNVTGTVLASSGDNGMVQLWKSDFRGNWKCVSQLNGSTATNHATAAMMQ